VLRYFPALRYSEPFAREYLKPLLGRRIIKITRKILISRITFPRGEEGFFLSVTLKKILSREKREKFGANTFRRKSSSLSLFLSLSLSLSLYLELERSINPVHSAYTERSYILQLREDL